MKEEKKNYLILAVLALMLVLCYYLLKDILLVIISGCALSYIFYPLFKKINKQIKKKRIAALVTIITILLLFTIPLFIMINAAIGETNKIITTVNTITEKQNQKECTNIFCRTYNQIYNSSNSIFKQYNSNIEDNGKKIINTIAKSISEASYNFIVNIPAIVIKTFIILFIMYYLFIDGENVIEGIKSIIPLQKKNQEILFERVNTITFSVLYGQLITAIIQGTIGGIGFFILGLPNPILWGFIMTLLALIPFIGTVLVWGPASIFLVIIGIIDGNNILIIKGVILFFYGLLIISTIDNIIKPKIIGKKADVHPLIVLIGIIVGINFFGLIGIILGPLTLSLTITLIKMYNEGTLT